MLPENLKPAITSVLSEKFGTRAGIESFNAVGGGCINNGGRLQTSEGEFFIKWNSASRFPGMFEVEARGLKLLGEPGVIDVPEVMGYSEAGGEAFILLEMINARPKKEKYWELLGEQLANLHKNRTDTFGLDHDNYIGSLPQYNDTRDSWIEFFIEQRLKPQVKMGHEAGKLNASHDCKFEKLFGKLEGLMPGDEKPSLIHGDLWSGNLITNDWGEPCIIDPAVYYGNREIEISFTQLFGGFGREFYDSYHNCFPLASGFEERVDLYNLYPLMVHVNLFGGYYLSQVESVLRRFV